LTNQFNVTNATVAQWEEYLTKDSNHETSFKGDFTQSPRSDFERLVSDFVQGDYSLEQRVSVVSRVVEATLNSWGNFAFIGNGFLSLSRHPFMCIPALAYAKDVYMEVLHLTVCRLWERVKEGKDFSKPSAAFLIDGFGKHVPLSDDELTVLYREKFKRFSYIALSILLERCKKDFANALFLERVSEFGDVDPIALDYLVHRGITPESAKVWLDQSVNAKAGHEGNYSDALKRWKEISTMKK
jgi:hypothetical protein